MALPLAISCRSLTLAGYCDRRTPFVELNPLPALRLTVRDDAAIDASTSEYGVVLAATILHAAHRASDESVCRIVSLLMSTPALDFRPLRNLVRPFLIKPVP